MKLQLDTDALEALFPEGTEARLDLQQAVLQNIVNRNFIKMNQAEVDGAIHKAVRDFKLPDMSNMINERLRGYVERATSWGNSTQPSESLKDHVQNHTKNLVDAKVEELITKSIKDRMVVTEAKVNTATKRKFEEFEKRLSETINQSEKEQIDALAKIMNERFDDVIKAAISQRLGV